MFAFNAGETDYTSQFHQCSTYSFCERRSLKCKNSVKLSVSFYAFGIYHRKSCIQNIDEIDPRYCPQILDKDNLFQKCPSNLMKFPILRKRLTKINQILSLHDFQRKYQLTFRSFENRFESMYEITTQKHKKRIYFFNCKN